MVLGVGGRVGEDEDGIVVQPLIDPETSAYNLWNWLELIEAFIGVGLGWLIFIQLANVDYTRGEGSLPPSNDIGLAMVSFFASNCDLIFNILGKFWITHGYMKYIKYLLGGVVFIGTALIVINIYTTVYQNPACMG